MFRRRRRSSVRWIGDRRTGPIGLAVKFGLPAALVIAGFIFLLNKADQAAPERQEVRIELPNTLAQ